MMQLQTRLLPEVSDGFGSCAASAGNRDLESGSGHAEVAWRQQAKAAKTGITIAAALCHFPQPRFLLDYMVQHENYLEDVPSLAHSRPL